ncbi:MAG TPA: tRNA 4-thiouridine(8) synthase ThiI [bacterium]|nr:tRNA 4-thiouridine(8) synthase ThiI [bacterium]
MSKIKALVLFSGGLDSLLAVKILELQDIEVTGLCFASNFFSCENAKKSADINSINLKVVDISEDILNLVKNPPSGYGKNLNPCIDCHSLMIGKAAKIMKNENYDFIATGEVLGQRPFSQNRVALERVKKIAGVDVLRPLSAKLLPETEAEKSGLVKRHRLLDISGRMRERQMELAQKLRLTYPSPAGGCLLTDLGFSERLIKMLDYWPDCQANDIELLKYGRVFWSNLNSNKKNLIIIGRNAAENDALGKLAKRGDIMVELNKDSGPTSLIRGVSGPTEGDSIFTVNIPEHLEHSTLSANKEYQPEELIVAVAVATGSYVPKLRGKKIEIRIIIK